MGLKREEEEKELEEIYAVGAGNHAVNAAVVTPQGQAPVSDDMLYEAEEEEEEEYGYYEEEYAEEEKKEDEDMNHVLVTPQGDEDIDHVLTTPQMPKKASV